jgi:hypothetical protein
MVKGVVPSAAVSGVYSYDTIGRLEAVTDSSADDAFDFDAVGNLIAKSGKVLGYPGSASGLGPHQVGSYGTETILYDENGNRERKSGPGVPLETYTYNALDQLVRIGVGYLYATFVYDHVGRRIAKEINGEPLSRILYFSEFAETEGGTLTKHFYAGGVLIASSHEDFSLAGSHGVSFEIPPGAWLLLGSVVVVLLFGAGLPVAPLVRVAPERVLAVRALGAVLLVLSAGPPVLLLPTPARAGGGGGGPPPPYLGMRHYHLDRLGSTQVVTDDLGAVLQQVRYDAYGVIRLRVDANGDPLDPGPGGPLRSTGFDCDRDDARQAPERRLLPRPRSLHASAP